MVINVNIYIFQCISSNFINIAQNIIIIIARVETIDGSANEGEDYIAISETLTFEPYQKEKEVTDKMMLMLVVVLSLTMLM